MPGKRKHPFKKGCFLFPEPHLLFPKLFVRTNFIAINGNEVCDSFHNESKRSKAATHSTLGKRISIESPDGKYIANFWRRGDKWVYSIQNAWDQSQKKKENPRTKTKQ